MAKRQILTAFMLLLSCGAPQVLSYQVVLNYSHPYFYQKTLEFEALPDKATIGDLKLFVHQKTRIPLLQMAIFLEGDFMSDEQLLQESAQHGESKIDIWIGEGGCLSW